MLYRTKVLYDTAVISYTIIISRGSKGNAMVQKGDIVTVYNRDHATCEVYTDYAIVVDIIGKNNMGILLGICYALEVQFIKDPSNTYFRTYYTGGIL